MAIVVLLCGIILVSLISAYQVYTVNQRRGATVANEKVIQDALNNYYFSLNHYPCPAAPGANDGVEVCTGLPPAGTCNANGLCVASGRDADGDGTADLVIIGVVPFATMQSARLPADNSPLQGVTVSGTQIVDGWDHKIFYAVSQKLTSGTTFNPTFGAIDVVDENNIDVLALPGSAHYVLYSAGDDGAGAYTKDGVLYAPCAPSKAEGKNCDNDATFISGLRAVSSGNNYNDDILSYAKINPSSLWNNSATDPSAAANTNAGNVGIGTDQPEQKLDVRGNIQAIKAYAHQVCDSVGKNCYDPNIIAGTGVSCPQGQAMIALGRANADADPGAQCAQVFPALININCGSKVLAGYTVNAQGIVSATCVAPP